MRILFLTPQPPYPPNKGTSTRNYNLIKNVAARHEVHLLTFADSTANGEGAGQSASAGEQMRSLMSQESLDHLRPYCATLEAVPAPPRRSTAERLGAALLSSTPDLARRLASVEFRAQLAALLEQTPFDLVHVEGLEMAPHWLGLASAGAAFPKTVLDAHNAEYVLQRRAFTNDLLQPRRWPGAAYSLFQWPKLRRYEAMACRLAAGVVAVSKNDRRALRAIAPDKQMAVVPNGIDTEYFRPGQAPREKSTLVFTGTMDFRPNVDAVMWFCHRVFPRIRAEAPDAHFYIVGQRPRPEVQQLAQMPGVVVTGSVADVRPYLWRAALCVVPLRVGGGTRFKVLEAMACGTPVVSTTLGAEGIRLRPAEHVILADATEEFAASALDLLREPERARAMAARGQAFAVANYEWKTLVGRLLAFYEGI